MNKDDQICAICKYNTESFHCGNPNQTNKKLIEHIKYNDTCELFELRDESFYDEHEESNDLKL